MSLADNIAFLSRLPKMPNFGGVPAASPLSEVEDFGTNPGMLSMWCYVPPQLPPNSPLVVVLHGCTQTASAYDHGSGWSAIAARYGFAVLMPEQRRTNNPNLCFNWFDPEKTARGGGEVLSIHRMIAAMVRLHRVSARRIYITGLSAGGAMASAMLAAYPEVFAGGAIIAGLPYGVAGNVREALGAMSAPATRPPGELGQCVRDASSHRGPWPKISVWHGVADRTVNPTNADQIVAQWLDVHQLPPGPMAESTVDGQTKQVWWDAEGKTIVESYAIKGMAHGVPLGIAGSDEPYGAVGPFMLESGIASTFHIAQFFELIGPPRQNIEPGNAEPSKKEARAAPLDVGAVITRALTAAGLIK